MLSFVTKVMRDMTSCKLRMNLNFLKSQTEHQKVIKFRKPWLSDTFRHKRICWRYCTSANMISLSNFLLAVLIEQNLRCQTVQCVPKMMKDINSYIIKGLYTDMGEGDIVSKPTNAHKLASFDIPARHYISEYQCNNALILPATT